ncbi:MAG: MOSC domain-containing protein [Hyphomicrobium sp.]|uniref:MOSC domain-containing protein n=1 Tax=Hyphomicrobium sp. TaxID=82 RepID=UPI003D10D1F8
MTGRLIAIARRGAVRAPMEEIAEGVISVDGGLAGDHKGAKFPRRRITVLAREDWEAALADLSSADGLPVRLPWTTRRANLFVEGVRLPRARGAILRVGSVELEVTFPTQPCRRMEEAHAGLLKALHPAWRGGVTCQVLMGGDVRIGDAVEVLSSPPEHEMRLP